MANKAYSVPSDLMLGAGTLYIKRLTGNPLTDNDMSGFVILGNIPELSLTTEITSVEKNSSMTKERELMAKITTAVKPSMTLTLEEYDPANLALGLYGKEAIHTQAQKTIVNEVHDCNPSSVIMLTDTDGKPYYNVTNVVMKPIGGATPPVTGVVTAMTTLGSQASFTASGTYTGTTNKTLYFKVEKEPTNKATNNTLGGLEIAMSTTPTGPFVTVINPTIGGQTTVSQAITDGITLDVDSSMVTQDPVSNDYETFLLGEIYSLNLTAGRSVFIEGPDYTIDDLEIRAGIIRIPATTSIPAGPVSIDYDVPSGKYPKVSGANAGSIMAKIMFSGDPSLGNQYVAHFHKCEVTPSGDLTGLIGTDFGSFQLTVSLLSDRLNHPDDPYYSFVRVGEAKI